MKIFQKRNKEETKTKEKPLPISRDLEKNIAKIKTDFGESTDLIINYFELKDDSDFRCANLYIKGMVEGSILNNLSIEMSNLKCQYNDSQGKLDYDTLKNFFTGFRATREGSDYETLYNELIAGNTVFLLQDYHKFFVVITDSSEGRSITEPTSQTIIRGPKDSFTESIDKNVFLLRKKIKNKDLRVESLTVGTVTHTAIRLMYIQNIARDDIVEELRKRLSKIDIDCILDSSYIEELIKDDRYTIFPTFLNSERPDTVAAAMLEGRVAIIIDGTPYVLTAPAVMMEFLQVSEDYYNSYFVSSTMRVLRIIAMLLTLLVPALYIALITYHQEIIPTTLLISIMAQREGVPFPAFFEVLLLELTFEVLREAGIRMPRAIGPAISIVGALVLGQAAVEAGLISAVVVIVVAATAISSFAIPNYGMSNAIRLLRFFLMILGGVLGIYGVSMGLIIIILHLCKLKSVTVPYLSPIAPMISGGNKDTFFRFPLWKMNFRPLGIRGTDNLRTNGKDPVDPSQKSKPEF